MNNYTDIILKYRLGEMTISERREFNHILNLNMPLRKEFIFQEKLDKILKKSLLLQEIETDPFLIKAEILACRDIDAYWSKGADIAGGKDKNILNVETEIDLRKKVAKAQVEMVLSGIDDVSADWVRQFDENKSFLEHDSSAQKIVGFVKKSTATKEVYMTVPSFSYRINKRIGFQAVAAVLVFSLFLFKSLTPSFTGESMYKSYYEPMEANSYSLRGTGQEAGEKFHEGVNYYMQKEYSKADLSFNSLRNTKEKAPEVLLYSGLNKMGQGHFAAAIILFDELLSEADHFTPEAQWYLGLCYIKTGENLKARALMESLSETEGLYKKRAQVILNNLNR